MAIKKAKKSVSRAKAPKALTPLASSGQASAPAAAPQGGGGGLLRSLVVVALLVGVGLFVRTRMGGKTIKLTLETQVSGRGTGPGQVLGCRAIAADAEGNAAWIFGGGDQMNVQKFSSRGAFVALYKAKKPAENLVNVSSMAFGPDGSLWLSEKGSGRVVRLSKELKFEGAFNVEEKELSGLAVDPDGNVWVAARGLRLDVYDPKGKFLREFKGTVDAPIHDPYRLAFADDGALAVIDGQQDHEQSSTITLYAKDGSFISRIKVGKGGDSACLAWDPSGLVVTNLGGLRVFDRKGKFKGKAMIPDVPEDMTVAGMAISANGTWLLDMTGVGLGGVFYRPTLEAKAAEAKK